MIDVPLLWAARLSKHGKQFHPRVFYESLSVAADFLR